MPLILFAVLLAAPLEHATPWSAPVHGIRARLVEAQAEPFLAIEVENVGAETVTFVQELAINRDTASCHVVLWVNFSECFSFANAEGFLHGQINASHRLMPGARERVRLFVPWDKIPRSATALAFRAELIAHVPSPAGPTQWAGRVQTPELTPWFVHRP